VSDLKPEVHELVQASREAFLPSDADRERVFQALLPRLDDPLGADAASVTADGALKATLLKISAAVVGVGIAGGGLYLALRPEPAKVEAPSVVTAKPAPVPNAPAPDLVESTPPAPPQAEPAAKRSPAASRSADSLAQEVAILSRASSELRAGRPAAALKALDEHQRSFPSGVLTQERTAARIQALCALGRTKEARSALERLARTSPNSPHEARARKACGFGAAGEE
jgi:hypothetical protein